MSLEFAADQSLEPILPIELVATQPGEYRFHVLIDGERAYHAALRVVEQT